MGAIERGAVFRQVERVFNFGTIAGLADAQLLERFLARRDEAAFAALVQRHGPMVLATCRRVLRDPHDSEDAFQAVFLVLIRKAGSIHGREALGGWLHRVAVRVAVQANGDAARRRVQERRAGVSAAARTTSEDPGDDLGGVIHAEIDRLPDRYRLPLVLFYLEGLTRAETARQLRWSEGTVRGRLAKARQILRTRLQRRGAGCAVVALGEGLARKASAAVPADWVERAVRAAWGDAANALAARAIRALVETQLKAVLVWVLFAGAITLATAVLIASGADRGVEHGPPTVPAAAANVALLQAEAGEDEEVEVAGRVLDPDGRPFAGARVVFQFFDQAQDELSAAKPLPVRAVSDAAGCFRFRIGDPGFRFLQKQAYWYHPTVAALAEGYGPGWVSFITADEARGVTLQLVRDDVPINGRVLDLEGRPVASVTVTPQDIFAAPDESLDAWLNAVAKAKDNNDPVKGGTLHMRLDPAVWAHGRAVVTSGDGRFRLTGIGRERVVSLEFTGPTIVASFGYVHARTRLGPTFRMPMDRGQPEFGTLVYEGATFDFVAAPTRPIVGIVRDQDSGAPLAGVSIRSDRFAGNIISGRDEVRVTTDAEGGYRLMGMPGGAGNTITANPRPGQPYLGAHAQVPGDTGTGPAVVNFSLKRGVLIHGRVTNGSTGKSVRASIEYAVFLDNPHEREAKELHTQEVVTRDDGTYEVIGLPGRGLIAVRALEDRYLSGQGADVIAGLDEYNFRTVPHNLEVHFFHAFAEVKPAEDVRTVVCDVALNPGRTRRGTVLDPDGRPLAGVSVVGLNARTISPTDFRLSAAEFTALSLDPKHPRPLFFRREDKKLAAVVVLRGDEPEPPVVRLQPAASVSGRLLDIDGNPRTGFTVNCNIDPKPFADWFLSAFYLRPTVDGQGRFRVEHLVPGVAYNLDARNGNRLTGLIAHGLTLQPGEARDLGDIRTDGGPGDVP